MAYSKTILITCFHAFIPRNILRTRVLDILAHSPALRIIIAAPDHKRTYYEKMFGRENVVVVGMKANQPSRYFLGLLFQRFSEHMHGTETVRLLQERQRFLYKRTFYYFSFLRPLRFFWRSRFLVRAVRFFDVHFSPTQMVQPLFDHYSPDLIFATDVYNQNDVAFIQEAKRRAIPVVGMVRSWDKLTWLFLRSIPDRLLVWTDLRKEEAVRFDYVPREKITSVGIPHYDRYLTDKKLSRADFFKSINADVRKPLIFYTVIGDSYIRNNYTDRYVLELLRGSGFNVVVRFPVMDTVAHTDDFIPPPHMFINKPGVSINGSKLSEWEISEADDRFFMNALFHSDLVICGASSVAVDGAFFNKPIMLINFHPGKKDYWEGVIDYGFTHMKYLLESGGVRLIGSREQFFEWMDKYLADQKIDENGRARIVREQCGPKDAGSSERVARAVLELLHMQEKP